ncbi:ABC transporter substrate-binding protein [Sphingomonas jatrophae]|uniref:ABC-type nitrate/sulfonate/bicarbonate transport system, substrate-binding protein n=1 Tax=Sphingomonas jatrophae TaxID=1166337 RepID=A0A1I6K9X7_9SPHN|nr:ABC transporter substrate-binding protein [Sphingomonas jatrophae]SFR88021.1 ABC-type nitrate/sulfonate/bicarbonate transport system, substrate-binding protein [Sphingomonas jatrophae]
MAQPSVDTLWYTRCSVPTPFSFAAQFGWFEEEFAGDPIDVRSLRESGNVDELASHFEHSLPNSFRQGGSVPAIWARARGADTRVIALTWTDEHQAIIALPASGIRTAADLKGRRIGLPKHDITIDHNRASALRAFDLVLAREGLSLADVEMIDLPDIDGDGSKRRGLSGQRHHTYTSEAHALAAGHVEAIYVKDVRGQDVAHLLGAQIVVDIGNDPDPLLRTSNCTPRPLTVSAALLRDRPDIVDRFLARVVAAGEWAAANPDGAVRGIAGETGWSEPAVRRAFGLNVHRALGADLDPEAIEAFAEFVSWLAARSFIAADFPVHEWIDPAPLARVRAARATAPNILHAIA